MAVYGKSRAVLQVGQMVAEGPYASSALLREIFKLMHYYLQSFKLTLLGERVSKPDAISIGKVNSPGRNCLFPVDCRLKLLVISLTNPLYLAPTRIYNGVSRCDMARLSSAALLQKIWRAFILTTQVTIFYTRKSAVLETDLNIYYTIT